MKNYYFLKIIVVFQDICPIWGSTCKVIRDPLYLVYVDRMKKLVLLFIFLTLCISCSSKQNVKKSGVDEEEVTKKELKIVTITGKIEVYPQKQETEVYIVENWKTRSRITYRIVNHKEHKHILELKEKILKVKASLLEMKSPWTGKINLLEILETLEQEE